MRFWKFADKNAVGLFVLALVSLAVLADGVRYGCRGRPPVEEWGAP